MIIILGALFASYMLFFNKTDLNSLFAAKTNVPKQSSTEASNNSTNNSQPDSTNTYTKSEESSKNIQALNDEAVKSVNSRGISSRSKYLIYTDLSNQMVYIFTGRSSSWKLLKSFECSSGLGSYPDGGGTPTGTFTIAQRGKWFYSPKYQEGAEYWTQFSGNYLFHSFPMDENHNIKDTRLGTPLSHGCIRLAVENAKWINENIPKGTKVIIK